MEKTEKQNEKDLKSLKAKKAIAGRAVEYLQSQLTDAVVRLDGIESEIAELEGGGENDT